MTFKFSIAQINPTIGDIDGNIELMRSAAARALNEGASVVVFPELSLTGYYPADMLDDPAFQQRIESGLEIARFWTAATAEQFLEVAEPAEGRIVIEARVDRC